MGNNLKTRILKEDFGPLGGRVHLFIGPHTPKSLKPHFARLNCDNPEAMLRESSDDCFGICYSLSSGSSLIWINPENEISECYDSIVHELSHAIDNLFNVFGYECDELRARLMGEYSCRFFKALNLIVKK